MFLANGQGLASLCGSLRNLNPWERLRAWREARIWGDLGCGKAFANFLDDPSILHEHLSLYLCKLGTLFSA